MRTTFFLAFFLLVVAFLTTTATAQEAPPKSSAAAVAQYGVAARYQKLEQYDLAAKEWKKLVADHPNDPLAAAGKHYAGISQFQLGDYESAAASFQEFTSKHQEHELLEQALTNLGLAQYNLAQAAEGATQQKLYEQSVATFGKRREKFPDGKLAAESEFYRGESLYALGKKSEAAKVYGEWIAAHEGAPLDEKVRLALGATQTELDDPAAAIATLTELVNRNPSADLVGLAKLRLGEALLADSQFAKASEQFSAAARAEGFADADYALERQATAVFLTGAHAEAAALYESLPARFPESSLAADCRASAGKCYYQARQYPKAAELLATAFQAKSNDMELAHWWVRALLEAKEPAKALDAAESVLAKKADPQILLDKADALYELPDRRGESLAAYIAAAEAAKEDLAAEARHLAAATASELGEHPTAAEQAQLLLDAHPDSTYAVDARQTLAEAKLQTGAPGEAVALYRELLKIGSGEQQAEWSLRLAWALSASEDDAGVVEVLSPLIDQLSGSSQQQARYLLGSAWIGMKEYRKAIVPLHAAATADPPHEWSEEAALLLGRCQSENRNVADAVTTLDKLIASSPKKGVAEQALYRRGEYRAKLGDGKGAQQDYDKLVADWPNSHLAPYADYRWARIAMNGDDTQAAAERFAKLLAEYPDHTLAEKSRLAMATCLAQSGDHEQALAVLDQMPPGDPRVALARGTSLAQTGKLEDAIQALRKATEADFADRDRAWYELGWAYREAKQEQASREAFNKLVSGFPESSLAADTNFRIGESHYDASEFAEAVVPFRAAASHPNANPSLQEKAMHLAAWSLLKGGEAASAAGEFANQLNQHPQGELAPDAKWLIGEAQFKAGNHAEALAAYTVAREAQPTSPDLAPLGMLHAGQAAGQLEKWQESADWLNQVITNHSDYAGRSEADFELGRAQFNLGKQDEAMALFQKVADRDTSPLGARARFMEGELLFAENKYEAAVRSFFQVAYGYGEEKAPEEFHPWQAESLFEAARCLEQLDRTTAARKIYVELVERFPEQDKAKLAKERIKKL